MKVILDMPPVAKCSVSACVYNKTDRCHAKAITVGDGSNPGCDTFFESPSHSYDMKPIAGVGACKVASCRFNTDFECSASQITVGISSDKVRCMTFTRK